MDDLVELAGSIVDEFEASPGVQEFKRTVQHDDGSTTTYRVDFTEIDPTGYTARGVRQEGSEHCELPARRLARGDSKGLASWLSEV